jgi:uncharacterized membrane protein
MSTLDIAALVLFAVCWLLYQPAVKHLSREVGAINSDMTVVRSRWMANMSRRENRFLDSQLMGHALTSTSHFSSANLILIAAATGALFRSDDTYRAVTHMAAADTGPRWLFQAKLALVVLTLARGLLDFIWAIRQMNYTLAAVGAAPPVTAPPAVLKAYGEAAADVLNPALSSFNNGVRGYYFALSAAAWMLGPWAMIAVTLMSVALLYARQVSSSAARGVRRIRQIIEAMDATPPA